MVKAPLNPTSLAAVDCRANLRKSLGLIREPSQSKPCFVPFLCRSRKVCILTTPMSVDEVFGEVPECLCHDGFMQCLVHCVWTLCCQGVPVNIMQLRFHGLNEIRESISSQASVQLIMIPPNSSMLFPPRPESDVDIEHKRSVITSGMTVDELQRIPSGIHTSQDWIWARRASGCRI